MTAPIVMSCGDPAGIGPEVAAKSWSALRGDIPFVWIGDPRHLPAGTPVTVVNETLDNAEDISKTSLPVYPINFAMDVTPGRPNDQNAQGVVDAISTAVGMVKSGHAMGLCTAPISKAVLQRGADFAHPGHTEYLAHLDGTQNVVMMLASSNLKVVPATIHIPLEQVPTALTPETLEQCITITHRALVNQFGIQSPKIAVAGLNPHAGEDGRMGHQEQTLITPVLDKLRDRGMSIIGPLPADTMFHAKARAAYDAAICMYHDQALIPIKTLDFDNGVNVTLGLSFVRTSPDHGTAFDIAGQNIANPASTIAALRLASQLGSKNI